jgi:hypothetical protein
MKLTMYTVIVKLIFVRETFSSLAIDSMAGRYMLDETGDANAASEAMYTKVIRCHFGNTE